MSIPPQADLSKDRMVALYRQMQVIRQCEEQLARSLFPLGDLTKSDTRDIARESHLKTAEKEESMEICFVPDKDYGKFLQQAKLVEKHQGEIVDLTGRVLGHRTGCGVGGRRDGPNRRAGPGAGRRGVAAGAQSG